MTTTREVSPQIPAEDYLSPLSPELLIRILDFLPPIAIFNHVRLVSKAQHQIITSLNFMFHQQEHYFGKKSDLSDWPDDISEEVISKLIFDKLLNNYNVLFTCPAKYQSSISIACLTEDLTTFKEKITLLEKDNHLIPYQAVWEILKASCHPDNSEPLFCFLIRTKRTICLNYFAENMLISNSKDHFPFIIAARLNRLDIMQKLFLANNDCLNATDSYQQTALLWAASDGHIEIVKFLLERNASLEIKTIIPFGDSRVYPNYSKRTPLDWAIFKNQAKITPMLLSAYDERAPEFKHKLTQPIFIAVEHNCLDLVKILTERNRDVLLQRDHRQFTPFLLAASLGYTDLLEYFLHVLPKSIHHRVDPNKAPDNSLMANDSLILALAKDHLNAAILIMKQANLVEKQTCYTFLSRAPQEILSFLENRLPSYQLNFTLEQSIAEIHQWIKTFKTQLSDHPLEDLKTITQKLVDTHNNLLSYHNITTPMSKLETLLNEALAIMFGNPALTTHFIPNLSGKLIVKKSLFDFFKALEDDIKPYQLTTKIAIVPGT